MLDEELIVVECIEREVVLLVVRSNVELTLEPCCEIGEVDAVEEVLVPAGE